MQHKAVVSDSIVSIGYDETRAELEIEFEVGGTYRYFGVRPVVYRQFLEADSKGRFFHTRIRNRFLYARV